MTAAQLPRTDAAPVLVARSLAKRYRDVTALDGFDLSLVPGERVGIIGPNGSGKTTALRLLLGLERPDAGSVEVFGLAPEARAARARIGYLPEESALFPFLSARETLETAGQLHGFGRADRRRRADELLERLGLAAVARRRVSTFSKGMARRLAFGRAIVHRPAFLVLDEPSSGLDPEAVDILAGLARDASADGTAVLFSTHRLHDAPDEGDRFVVMARGRVVRTGTLDAVLAADGCASLDDLFRVLVTRGAG